MNNQEPKDIACKKIAWTITNFSTLKTNVPHYSDVFTIGDWAWRLYIYRGRTNNKSLAIYLEAADASSLPQGGSILAASSLTVVNQVSRQKSQSKGGIEPTSRPTYPSLSKQPKDTDIKDDDAVDFKDLGKIEKSFHPLLEEVCSWHPSLLDGKKNKSHKFTEWAFTALGRVLQFLKNKKWKDMNEEACEKLQHLWGELEMSRLDLSWLEPLVKSAINMKGYAEKVEKVKKLKQNLVGAEKEMNMIKEKLASTEQSVEITRKELMSAEQDFEEKDLDEKIGYGNTLGIYTDNAIN
ncbi:hypothetical protein K1719_035850 [Acacia pycnantha]|nr:hypothetical protein K1719_035850 [Acacia pycnantha]